MARAKKPYADPAPPPSLPWTVAPDGSRVYPEPTGPPAQNPLTAEHYQAIQNCLERMALLADMIPRAAHIGLNVDAHAAQTERDFAIVQRLLAKYPAPAKSPLEP